MHYRLATEADIELLAGLRWVHEFEETETPFAISKDDFIRQCTSFLKEGLATRQWAYWIAEEKGDLIANIFIRRIQKVPKPQKLVAEIGYITNVHTKIEYRNKGIGTELLKRVKQWATDNKIELLFLWPSEKSINYYKRQGFSAQNDILELEF
ncbi:RimJ/RimL family protein N-acetyltransferase [Pullulanibacillus pueri]|uniref:N-acetyltransferase domain-containing protein n=1 Tax=Pullulanibacillus pueri TaxID=1437324 RepID=A0A8J3ENR4_9BACL|nr:GNAT family N-acetyltransferase [Pullulanibacillus pueri]MBM7684172.1 RimJ/RimL family protein N-acetyltransferase [Pullulanibacillus pueri]GGH88826.1 hypothetical protein GCM10007096_42040 [Pullulanibacillus pueri]